MVVGVEGAVASREVLGLCGGLLGCGVSGFVFVTGVVSFFGVFESFETEPGVLIFWCVVWFVFPFLGVSSLAEDWSRGSDFPLLEGVFFVVSGLDFPLLEGVLSVESGSDFPFLGGVFASKSGEGEADAVAIFSFRTALFG